MEEIVFKNGSKAIPTNLKGCYIIKPNFIGDKRGYYVADYIKEDMEILGFEGMINHYETKSTKNYLRGMELDTNNALTPRIIRAASGDAIVIVIDARKTSSNYGEYTLVHINPYDSSDIESGKEIYVKAGFSHAILSLKDDTFIQEFKGAIDTNIKNISSSDELKPAIDKILSDLSQTKNKIKICKTLEDHGCASITPTDLQDCYIVKPDYVADEGGYRVSDFQKSEIQRLGFEEVYQHSESKSAKNVLRGMHFQLDPKCQAKLVRVVSGEVIDVVVDIRKDSPPFGRSIAVRLKPYDPNDPSSGMELYVPRGFAHGFISLTDNVLFQYFVDNAYAPELEEGILWSGEETRALFESILEENGIAIEDLIISDKDQKRLALKDKPNYFKYREKNKNCEYSFEVGM